jgi:purine-binding chemotaxis protein CheW
MQLVVFRLGSQRFALPLAAVDRIVRAVEVMPLPGAPGVVLGAINVGGCVVPVFCAGRRFGLQQRVINPDHQLLLARVAARVVAMVIDEALGVIECAAHEVVPSDAIVDGLERFQGVAALADHMVLIHDLEKFLSGSEAAQLAQALEHAA